MVVTKDKEVLLDYKQAFMILNIKKQLKSTNRQLLGYKVKKVLIYIGRNRSKFVAYN
jgi:hypothetical protein